MPGALFSDVHEAFQAEIEAETEVFRPETEALVKLFEVRPRHSRPRPRL